MAPRTNKKAGTKFRLFYFNLATTYSRRSYTATTIGKAAFDGRVRDGNGSVHCFMITKKSDKERAAALRPFSENYTQTGRVLITIHEFEIASSRLWKEPRKKAIKPHDRLVSVR